MGIRRCERWRAQWPFDVDEQFAEMLAKRGMSEADFLSALAAPVDALAGVQATNHDWLDRLRQAYTNPAGDLIEPLPGEEEIGFLNLVEPIVYQALASVWQGIESLPSAYDSLPFDVDTIEDILLANLPEALLMRLGRTMVLELNVLRLQGLLEGETAQARYLSFVQRLADPIYSVAILEEYPVLARQLVTCVDQWASVSLEFLDRLCQDWERLQARFSPEEAPGVLVELAGGAGDTHRRGRSVMIAAFESGLRIVYKPKSLAIDIHFQGLLQWLNSAGCRPPLRTMRTLDCGDYGWAEFIAREECADEDALHRFYRRQGTYLALLHILNASDFHFENVIAAGEHPVLIDLETMLQPEFDRYEVSLAEDVAEKSMGESVLEIGLLPMRIWSGGDYDGIDISGLGGAGGQLSPDRVPGLADSGTDAMHYVRERIEIEGDANRPILRGEEANAVDFVDDIVAGFESTYRLMTANKQELLRPGGLISRFADDEIRVLLRPTRTYGQLLHEAFHPDLLRDELDRDLFLDRLWSVVPARRHMRHAIASELEDLLAGDIPVFTTTPSSLDLFDASGHPISGVLLERGLDAVERCISNMNDADLDRQLWYIRASLATVAPEASRDPRSGYLTHLSGSSPGTVRILRTAREAIDYVYEQAVESADDAVWIGLQPQGEKYWAISTLGIDLYGGASGIALALAYAGVAFHDQRYNDLARRAYSSIRAQIELLAGAYFDVGGFEGWGGVLYACTHLGALWQDDAILDDAERVAGLMAGATDQVEVSGVARGCAGAIMALLGLYQVRPSDMRLSLAVEYGERLVAVAEPQPNGVGWVDSRHGDMPLAGFAHGASGIAVSLLQLCKATGDSKYGEVAAQAFAYERWLLGEHEGEWPDLRTREDHDRPVAHPDARQPVAWCNGAAGAGLARVCALRLLDGGLTIAGLDSDQMEAEIDQAIKSTLARGFGRTHCLCHGDLGNLEFLLQASRYCGLPHVAAEISRMLGAVLDSADASGWQCGGPSGIVVPGLMLGVAGIGYELLRLADPDSVPDILTMASPVVPKVDIINQARDTIGHMR